MQSTLIKGDGGEVVGVEELRNGTSNHYALSVSTRPGRNYTASSRFFLNSDFGLELNQDAGASGTPDGIHDGTDTSLWTASALSGTWDFSSTFSGTGWPTNGTQSIDATDTVNGDQALFSRASAIDSSSYKSISGKIYLTNFNADRHEVLAFFRLSGVNVGNSVDITDFVDTGLLDTALSFSIPLSLFNISGNVDELVIQTVRTSGSQPSYYLDQIQLEQSGTIVYTAQPGTGETFEFDTVEFFLADALDTTLLNSSMYNLSYDKILNVPQLTNGINLRVILSGKTLFSGTFRDLGDILVAAFNIESEGCDGTNTFLKLTAILSEFVPLRAADRDKVEITIADDLSGLLRFRAALRGRLLLNGV